MSLLYGIITGIIFGFLLQKAHVLRYDKQLGALRLIDMTIVKFMLSAIVVASIGIYFLKDMGLIQLNMKSTSLGAQLIGGVLSELAGAFWAIAREQRQGRSEKAELTDYGEFSACCAAARCMLWFIRL